MLESFAANVDPQALHCPMIHGQPHQSKAEVLGCLLAGRAPKRWSHVYTGNVQPSPNFEPVLPPIPPQLTPLARCLLGIDEFCKSPTTWWLLDALLESAQPKETVRSAEEAAVEKHRGLLFEQNAALTSRLIHLSNGPALGTRHAEETERSPLSECSDADIIRAAEAALQDKDLFVEDPRGGRG